MFFADRIKGIKDGDKVLEIGPGAYPHPRSDIFLEKIFETEEEALAQSGYSEPTKIENNIVYYKGDRFPFEDNEFDYVICSHVIEHVPISDLEIFIKELQRVAKRGYLEFPNVFYELINYQDVHIWLMNFRDGEMIFLDKNRFKSNNIHKVYRHLFYGNDPHMRNGFKKYKPFFFEGFEWEKGQIKYRLVDDFNELINEKDIEKWEEYFKNRPYVKPIQSPPSFPSRVKNAIKRRLLG